MVEKPKGDIAREIRELTDLGLRNRKPGGKPQAQQGTEIEKAETLRKLQETITNAQRILEENKIRKEALLKELEYLEKEISQVNTEEEKQNNDFTGTTSSILGREKGPRNYVKYRPSPMFPFDFEPRDSQHESDMILFERGEYIYVIPSRNESSETYFGTCLGKAFDTSSRQISGNIKVIRPAIFKKELHPTGYNTVKYELTQKGVLEFH